MMGLRGPSIISLCLKSDKFIFCVRHPYLSAPVLVHFASIVPSISGYGGFVA